LLYLKGSGILNTMKYPFHTQSNPVVGEAAQKLIAAIDEGKAVTNERALVIAKLIADRILAKRKSTSSNQPE
jgi:hypothetical protein